MSGRLLKVRRACIRVTKSFLFLGCVLADVGCMSYQGLTQAPKDAERLDAAMHASMTRGDWKGIFGSADEKFRASTDEPKFITFMSAVTTKLGAPVSSKQISWRLNATTSGTFLYSDCETVFSKNAKATESFVWLKAGSTYQLHGYRINSNDLITR